VNKVGELGMSKISSVLQ